MATEAGRAPRRVRWRLIVTALIVGVILGFFLTVILIRTGALGRPEPAGPNYGGSSIQESFTVNFADSNASKSAFASALQDAAVSASGSLQKVGLQIRPDYEQSSATSSVGSQNYLAAFDDAKQKAELLARHAGVALGSVESISEGYGGQPPPAANGPLKGVSVQAPQNARLLANGPVILAVSYRLGQGDPQRTISVLGFASAAGGSPARRAANATRLVVSINARGNDLAEASRAVSPYEGLIHKAAAKVGLPDSAISKGDVSFNVY